MEEFGSIRWRREAPQDGNWQVHEGSSTGALTTIDMIQCFLFSLKYHLCNPKIIHCHYFKIYFPDQSVPKTVYLHLRYSVTRVTPEGSKTWAEIDPGPLTPLDMVCGGCSGRAIAI